MVGPIAVRKRKQRRRSIKGRGNRRLKIKNVGLLLFLEEARLKLGLIIVQIYDGTTSF